jgi:hypothetical protein
MIKNNHEHHEEYTVIFRRFIRRKNGYVDDARKHGLKAWPIRVYVDSK